MSRSSRHFRDRRWFKSYRARMDAGLEPCRNDCGRLAATFDHIRPVGDGGSNRITNITLLCEPCNHEKGMKRWGWLLALAYEPNFAEVVGVGVTCDDG